MLTSRLPPRSGLGASAAWRSRLSALGLALASLAGACSTPAPASGACGEGRDLVCAMSDYASSGVAALRLVDGAQESRFGVDLGKDPQLSRSRGRLFLVARDQDLLFELDPGCGAPVRKLSVHDENARGTQNPQDVAVDASGALWVPRFNDGSLLVIAADGARVVLPLGEHDEDGNPQPAAVTALGTTRGERVFVTLERLDRDLVSRRPSALLEIDPAARAVVASHPLLGKNPFGATLAHEGALWLAAPGDFDLGDEAAAGVERFDPESRTSTLVVRERDLGASVVQVAISGGCGAAIVAGPIKDVNPTSLVTFDARTGRVVMSTAAPALATPGFHLQGLAFAQGALFVGDRRPATGGGYLVHAFDMGADCTLRARPGSKLSLPQKPVAMLPVALTR